MNLLFNKSTLSGFTAAIPLDHQSSHFFIYLYVVQDTEKN